MKRLLGGALVGGFGRPRWHWPDLQHLKATTLHSGSRYHGWVRLDRSRPLQSIIDSLRASDRLIGRPLGSYSRCHSREYTNERPTSSLYIVVHLLSTMRDLHSLQCLSSANSPRKRCHGSRCQPWQLYKILFDSSGIYLPFSPQEKASTARQSVVIVSYLFRKKDWRWHARSNDDDFTSCQSSTLSRP